MADAAPDEEPQQDLSAEALGGLAQTAPEDLPPEDTTAEALGALADAAPIEAAEEDTSAETLAALAEVDAPPEPEAGTVGDTLSGLADAAPEIEASEDAGDDVLSSLADIALPEETGSDTIDDALSALAEAAPEPTIQDGGSDDALTSLAEVELPEEPTLDVADEALSGLAEVQPDEPVAADTTDNALAELADMDLPEAPAETTGDTLAALGETAFEVEPDEDQGEDALAGLADLAVDAPESNDTADAFAGLAEVATETTEADSGLEDALSDLANLMPEDAAVPDTATLDDALAGLADLDDLAAPASADEAPDALAGLADLGETVANDLPETDAEALSGLADLGDIGEAGADTTLDDALAGLGDLAIEGAPPETSSLDDALAGIADLGGDAARADDDAIAALEGLADIATDPATDEVQEDPLAGLADLVSPDAEAAADDLDAALEGLAGLEGPEEAVPEDDPLAGLADLVSDAEAPADDLDTALEGLAGLGEPDEAVSEGDPLAGLADLVSPDAEAPADDLDAALEGLAGLGEPDEAVPEGDPLAGLADLVSPDAEVPAGDLDAALEGLAGLGGAEEAVPEDDLVAELALSSAPVDELDDLLGDLGGAPDTPSPTAEPSGADDLDALLDALGGIADDGDDEADGDFDLDDLLKDDAFETDETSASIPTDAPEVAGPALDLPQPDPTPEPDMPFGRITALRPARAALRRDRKFRIAVFGDFTGRAARGLLEPGAALAGRKGIPLDVDTIDEVIEGFATTLVLPVGDGGTGIEVSLESLDDLEPDELFDKLAIFSELGATRKQLSSAATSASAVATLTGWGADFGAAGLTRPATSAAASVPADRKLSDFQALIGDTGGRLSPEPAPAADLIARIVAPHVVAAPDPQAPALQAAVDAALSDAMRLVLHHPDFQAVEAQWRSLDLLARRIETDETLEITLYDVSAEELAVDLSADDDLSNCGLFECLTARQLGTEDEPGPGGYSAIVGLYQFEETPPHAELLGRIAQVAARAMPEAKYLGVASPRFMLRRPYGKKSAPIDAFDFEEFTPQAGVKSLLWANPAVMIAILLARAWRDDGKAMSLGQVMSLDDIPYHYMTDAHGDQVALPCTERNLTTKSMEDVVTRGIMPLVSMRGRDVVRLGSYHGVGGGEILGRWSDNPPPASATPPRRADLTVEGPAGGDDLDSLLAAFEDAGTTSGPSDPNAIDPELAALLEDL